MSRYTGIATLTLRNTEATNPTAVVMYTRINLEFLADSICLVISVEEHLKFSQRNRQRIRRNYLICTRQRTKEFSASSGYCAQELCPRFVGEGLLQAVESFVDKDATSNGEAKSHA